MSEPEVIGDTTECCLNTVDDLLITFDNICITDHETNDNKCDYYKKLLDVLTTNFENYKKIVLQSKTLKEACVKCKIFKLSGQVIGPLIEKYIISNNGMKRELSSNRCGDCSINNTFIEIKISIGGKKHNKFNYVQLRMNHKIDIYILVAYYLHIDNIHEHGELFIFNIPKNDMKELILNYGNYAHGTKLKNGNISLNDLNDINNNKEYSIRPKYGSECWNALLKLRVKTIGVQLNQFRLP